MSDEKIRKVELPEGAPRVETGTVQFGDDWPGTFFRGDAAAYYALHLAAILHHPDETFSRMIVDGLYRELMGCVVGPGRIVVKGAR
jgi:hypothetical protein